ncbi:gag-pol fusion protein-like protein, partial [Dinothrombium tinctorium]
ESTSEWASPILIVLKEDPNEPTKIKRRFVTDFRELNAHTVKDPYPMPLIADIMLCFASAKYFTALDLNSGFWQIPLRPIDRMKTAFVTLDGLYEYLVMAMDEQAKDSTIKQIKDELEMGNDPKLVKFIVDSDGVVYRQGSGRNRGTLLLYIPKHLINQ